MSFRSGTRRIKGDTAVDDRGFTLVEIVMTIAIMSIVIAPLLILVMTTIRASSQATSAEQVETVMQNAADRVNRSSKKCDYTIYVESAAQSVGWAPTRAKQTVDRYAIVSGSWSSGGCDLGSTKPAPGVVQRVTITVTSPDGSIRRTTQVVKSDV
jgi:prepilin-type N-terminal cleavage/methylation domain-containing protein